MFVRCSDPDIICETKNMVLVMLRCPSAVVVLSANALHPVYQPVAVKPWQRWSQNCPLSIEEMDLPGAGVAVLGAL